jgi:hypothetical protein
LIWNNTRIAIEQCFKNPEVGESKFCGLTARDIIAKKVGWEDAYTEAFEVIPTPKQYR